MTNLKVDHNLSETVQLLSELCEKIDTVEEKVKALRFVTINDVVKATGWTKGTVCALFNRADFPSCDFGKTKVAELSAVIKSFSVPRRKE